MRWRNLDKLSLVQRLKGPTGRLTTHSSSEINCAVSRRASAGASAAFIAEQIGVGRSTIYREWRRCGGCGRFNAPLMRVKARAAGGQQRPMLGEAAWSQVEAPLQAACSQDPIAGRNRALARAEQIARPVARASTNRRMRRRLPGGSGLVRPSLRQPRAVRLVHLSPRRGVRTPGDRVPRRTHLSLWETGRVEQTNRFIRHDVAGAPRCSISPQKKSSGSRTNSTTGPVLPSNTSPQRGSNP